MSGNIRKVLGPARARCKTLIDKATDTYTTNPAHSNEQRLNAINATRVKIKFDIDKLQAAVDFLLAKDRDWCMILTSLSSAEDKAKEQKYYDAAIDDPNGHYNLIMAGEDKLSEMRANVLELDFLFETTQRKLTEDLRKTAAGSSAASNTSDPPPNYLKLPAVEHPKFHGDPVQWKSFWDFFRASVDSQPISDVQKFSYLSTYLFGSASAAIKGLAITDRNYRVALGILQRRFGDDTVVTRSLFAKLRNLQPASNNAKSLRKFLDEFESVIRQLESEG